MKTQTTIPRTAKQRIVVPSALETNPRADPEAAPQDETKVEQKAGPRPAEITNAASDRIAARGIPAEEVDTIETVDLHQITTDFPATQSIDGRPTTIGTSTDPMETAAEGDTQAAIISTHVLMREDMTTGARAADRRIGQIVTAHVTVLQHMIATLKDMTIAATNIGAAHVTVTTIEQKKRTDIMLRRTTSVSAIRMKKTDKKGIRSAKLPEETKGCRQTRKAEKPTGRRKVLHRQAKTLHLLRLNRHLRRVRRNEGSGDGRNRPRKAPKRRPRSVSLALRLQTRRRQIQVVIKSSGISSVVPCNGDCL